jgi:hypothetical protein
MATAAPPETKTDATEEENEPLFAVEAFAEERPTLRVHASHSDKEGVIVELRLMREFGIAEQQRLTQDGAEYEKLWNKPNLSKKEGERLKVLLDRMFDKVLVADAKLKAKIDDQQRSSVVTAFTYAPLAMAAARERREQEAKEKAEKAKAKVVDAEVIDESTTEN